MCVALVVYFAYLGSVYFVQRGYWQVNVTGLIHPVLICAAMVSFIVLTFTHARKGRTVWLAIPLGCVALSWVIGLVTLAQWVFASRAGLSAAPLVLECAIWVALAAAWAPAAAKPGGVPVVLVVLAGAQVLCCLISMVWNSLAAELGLRTWMAATRSGPGLVILLGDIHELAFAAAVLLAAIGARPKLAAAGAYPAPSAPGQYPAPVPQGQYPAPVPTRGTNGLAVASLVLALTGAGNILAIILGHIARSQIRRTGERGAGMALAGLILGYLALGLAVAVVLLFTIALAAQY
jgi:hypothetical protein